MKLLLLATDCAIKLVANGILYGRCRRIKKLSHRQTSIFKSEFDHVDFAISAKNEKLTYWTRSLQMCWRVGLPTFTTVIKSALGSFFPFVFMLQ